jgi:hypothetical protein
MPVALEKARRLVPDLSIARLEEARRHHLLSDGMSELAEQFRETMKKAGLESQAAGHGSALTRSTRRRLSLSRCWC